MWMKYNCGWIDDKWIYLGEGRTDKEYNEEAREICIENAYCDENRWEYELVEFPSKEIIIEQIRLARLHALSWLKTVEKFKNLLKKYDD
jgi:hypothetical protein